MIKAVAFDIDGTLIPYGEPEVSASALAAIEQARSRGVIIIISSGRVFGTMHPDIGERVRPDYYVTVNGGCINRGDGNILQCYPMSDSQRDWLIDFALDNDYPFAFKFPNHYETYNRHEDFCKAYCRGGISRTNIGSSDEKRDYHLDHGNPLDGIIMHEALLDLDALKRQREDLTFYRVMNSGYEMYPASVNKGKSLKWLMAYLGLRIEECLAIGDSDNDIDMLRAAGVGVAMGNSTPAALQAADYVTDDITHDGIWKALARFGVIE